MYGYLLLYIYFYPVSSPPRTQEAAFAQAQSEAEAREAERAALAAEAESLVAERDGLR